MSILEMFKSLIFFLFFWYLIILLNDFFLGVCLFDLLVKIMCGFLEDSFIYLMGKFLFVWFKIDIFVIDRGFSILYVLLNLILIGIILFNCCIILIFFG